MHHLICKTLTQIIFVLFSIISLTACSENSDETGPGDVTPTANRLFVHDNGSGMGSVETANPAAGTLTFDTLVAGSNTRFGNVDDYALDINNDRLYVSNANSILVFDNVSSANGNVAPSRTITSTSFGTISHLFLDTINNELYATDDIVGLWVIANANSANGNITPVRGITGNIEDSSSFSIYGVAVDVDSDVLYLSVRISSPYTETILAYNNASTINGTNVMADRAFTSNNMGGNPGQIVFDAENDRLYMADSGSYAVRVFDNVSTLDGTVDPSRTINLGVSITDIKVDLSNNRLYALNPSLFFIIDNASTASGTVSAKQLQVQNTFPILNAIAVAP